MPVDMVSYREYTTIRIRKITGRLRIEFKIRSLKTFSNKNIDKGNLLLFLYKRNKIC